MTFCASYFKVSLIVWETNKYETGNISDRHMAEERGQEALQKLMVWAKGSILRVGRCLKIRVSCLVSCGKKVFQGKGCGCKKSEPKSSVN